MATPSSNQDNQVSYLNVTIGENGLSEFSGNRQIIFIPKEQIQKVEIRYGSHAENPVLQLAFGAVLSCLCLVGAAYLAKAGLAALRVGIGFIIFGGVGLFCIYETLKKGHYLLVTTAKESRKLLFKGEAQRSELLNLANASSRMGYDIQDRLGDTDRR